MIIRVIFSIIAFSYFIVRFILGEIFLTEIFISTLYFVLYYYTVVFLDNYVDNLIKKTAFISDQAKKYVFYWFFWVILLEILMNMLYSGNDQYVSIEWIQNYISCQKSKNNLLIGVPYNELVGPWFSYLHSTCLYGLIAGIFAVAHCFRNINEFEWFGGSLKLRVVRVVIAWVSMIPSWTLVVYQSKIINTDYIRLSGLNAYFLDAMHFFILYFWLFGVMPLYVFKKLDLINHSESG